MGCGAKVESLPLEKDTHSILSGLKVEGIGGDKAGLVLLKAER